MLSANSGQIKPPSPVLSEPLIPNESKPSVLGSDIQFVTKRICSVCTGNGAHFTPELVVRLYRNFHSIKREINSKKRPFFLLGISWWGLKGFFNANQQLLLFEGGLFSLWSVINVEWSNSII